MVNVTTGKGPDGKDRYRNVDQEDIKLSRYACYLVGANGNPQY